MNFSEIISISGKSGLFRLVNTRGDGIIVQSLEDGKSTFVSSRVHNVITLDNIAIYREHEETTPLREVMVAMKEKQSEIQVPEPGSDEKTLRAYLEKILPDYDPQRVHASDMKKLVKWYHILKQKDMLPPREDETQAKEETLRDEEQTTATQAATDNQGSAPTEAKPKKPRKTAAKKKTGE